MEFKFDLDLTEIERKKSDGQVNLKVPSDIETRFRILNVKYDKQLSRICRKFACELVEYFESRDDKAG